MPSSLAGRQLTEAHRLAQLRLGVAVVAQMHNAWQVVDPDDIEGSYGDWMPLVTPIAAAGKVHSALLAAAYMRTHRQIETGSDDFTPVTAGGLDAKAFTISMLVCGLYSARGNLGKGVAVVRAMEIADARTAASAMRYSLDGGRETITESVKADRRAVGWQRVSSGQACDFCASLDGEVMSEDAASFDSHDGCGCSAEPVWEAA
jgi:hypothetical protein